VPDGVAGVPDGVPDGVLDGVPDGVPGVPDRASSGFNHRVLK
jgi:hypothetical protein